ncbi:MAG: C25 family cysteine peptidase [Thermoplasmatota archaeon]
MKKIFPIVIILALIASGFGAIAIQADVNPTLVKTSTLAISEPVFSISDNYVSVNIKQQTSVRMDSDKPMTPVITQTFAFEPGTEIKNVDVEYDIKEYIVSDPIQPAPQAIPLNTEHAAQVNKEIVACQTVYTSDELYPTKPYEISYAFGLWKEEGRKQLVNIRINTQYHPAGNLLIVPDGEIKITIAYIEPKTSQTIIEDPYDMLIITPQQFIPNFGRFIEHKQSVGVSCIIKSLEDIYENYDGRNQPESIKLSIKDAIEKHDITFVLLGGGRYRQTMDWWLPEFRNFNDDGWESGYSSDLYFADVYKNNGTEFEDWDSNENLIFGEWRPGVPTYKDVMDFNPDVSVGRIPFHYGFELDIVLDKIISYESNKADDSWFKQAIMIAGDTFPNHLPYYEGEIETGYIADMLTDAGFSVEKIWSSLETLTGVPPVVQAISGGAGFIQFAGHGNPSTWSTHPPNDGDTWITGLSWTDMWKLRNRGQYPYVGVGGCHNAQFNATIGYIPHGIRKYGFQAYFNTDSSQGPIHFWLMEWVPRDFSSWLLLKKNGGSIATTGMAGLGYGYINENCLEGLGGWIEPRVFHAYAVQGIENVGLAHAQAITDYINILGRVNDDQIDRKTIDGFVLIGDPSLKLGGYE